MNEPLQVIINPPPSSIQQIYPGTTNDLSVVVINQDTQGIVVEVSLDFPPSSRLGQWCKVSRASFNLEGNRSQAIVFQWQIPPQAVPNLYRYDLLVDSPTLRAPIIYTLQLEILTPIQTTPRSHDPTFSIQPTSNSTNPIELIGIQPLIMQILVHNRSNRVDEFRLNCPDLEDNWYTVRYPETMEAQGAISGAAKLSLNPNAKGQITLQIHPPVDTLAGNYSPTIRLYSAVNSNLLLQEIIYLTILPVYQLQIQLQVIRDRVRQRSAQYDIILQNQGNTIREIKFQVGTGEEEECCEYELERPQVRIPPGKTKTIWLKVKPTKRSRRPFYGAAKPLSFQVNTEDINHYPLPKNLPLKGTIFWESRPWWQLLLILLSILVSLASLIFFLWWLFFKPSLPPEIISLGSADSVYQFNQEILLNWELTNTKQVENLEWFGKDAQGQVITPPRSFKISDLPTNCQLTQETLNCRSIPTGAKKPGNYIFTLNLWGYKEGKPQKIATKDTSSITIEAPPTPTVANAGFTKEKYLLDEQIILKFQVTHVEEIDKIEILRQGIIVNSFSVADLGKICQGENKETMTCNLPIKLPEPGTYSFGVKVSAKNQYGEPQNPVETKPITVEERIIPLKILQFVVNGSGVSPIRLQPNQKLSIQWQVSGKNVKVNISGITQDLPPQGRIEIEPFSEKYSLTLTATDAYGKSETKELFIQVEAPPSPSPISSP